LLDFEVPVEMERKENRGKQNLNKKKNMKVLSTKKTPDMNEKKLHMKVVVNVPAKMNMEKSIEANMTMAMKVNMNE
jgi:hypothetical protein